MSVPTFPHAQKLLSLAPKDATNVQVQNLIENGDLYHMLFTDADLAKVDRSAFRALLAPPPKSINWTPVSQYADKLRDWNGRFHLGLTEEQISGLAAQLPDHAGPHQPTGITLTLGEGLKGDRKVIQQIIKYELGKLGVSYRDYLEDAHFSYYSGSEPIKEREPHLAPALLDIGRFWDPQNGVVVRKVREQLAGQPLPGLEVDWLMALNPQVLIAIDYETVPGFLATGLVVDSVDVPVFHRDDVEAYVYGGWDGSRWYDFSCVAFREC